MKHIFSIIEYYRGMEFYVSTVAKSMADAAKLIDVSPHRLKKYGVRVEYDSDESGIPDDGNVFVRCGYGSEVRILFAGFSDEYVLRSKVIEIIDRYIEHKGKFDFIQRMAMTVPFIADEWRKENEQWIKSTIGVTHKRNKS